MDIKEKYKSLKNDNKNPFCDMGEAIIDSIQQYGLGVLPKSDLEGLIFHNICNAIESEYVDNIRELDYVLMQMLRISPTKLRSLRVIRSAKYLNNLNYKDPQNQMRLIAALRLASVGNCDITSGKINISISDPHAQNLIERMIEDNQGIVEHSINPKLLALNAREFLNMIVVIFGDGANDGYERTISAIKEEVRDIHVELTKDNIFDEFKNAFQEQAFGKMTEVCLKIISKAVAHKLGLD